MPEQRTTKELSILANIDTNVVSSSRSRRKNGGSRRRSSLSIESYDDELYEKLPSLGEKREKKSNRRSIVMDGDSEDDGEQYLPPLKSTDTSNTVHDAVNNQDQTKEKVVHISEDTQNFMNSSKNKNRKSLNKQFRKRRRSSARYLRLSGRFGEESTDELTQLRNNADQEKLGDMYRQAIRLNAENKINAANSWGLNFIENMDKFLGDEGEDDEMMPSQSTRTKSMTPTSSKKQSSGDNSKSKNSEKRVNFTKASCTLDASVKIYSYRVDDVHLSSYKVLANLNRTDNGKKGKGSSDLNDETVSNDGINGNDAIQMNRRRNVQSRSGVTLERNPVNININKLDSAYDIDPLFHQMSQKFDEGGAKGLLLVNLSVANDGCRVVLDSKEDSQVPNTSKSLLDIQPQFIEGEEKNDESLVQENDEFQIDSDQLSRVEENKVKDEGEIDISCLCDKLQELLHSTPIDTLQFVPQLEDLRSEYRALEEEGFVDNKMHETMSRRYKIASEEEEKEAEEYIHREIMERTGGSILNNSMGMNMSFGLNTSIAMNMSFGLHTLSQGAHNSSMMMEPIIDNEESFGEEDFGNENEEFGDNDDAGFGNFLDSQGSDPLNDEFASKELFPASQYTGTKKAPTTLFLDALCSSDAFNGAGEYEYFNVATLNKITKGNLWAGSTHWKKTERKNKKTSEESSEDTRQKRKRSNDTRSYINFSTSDAKHLESMLEANCTSDEKSKSLLISNTTRQKQNKELNLLPPDAGIEMNQLSSLFLRPKARLLPTSEETLKEGKRVGFVGVETYTDGGDEFCDDNFDGGQGFEFSNNDENFAEKDDYVVGELSGVRKVDKVFVEHATVAKTVDVRKLKKDLWAEVDQRTNSEEEEKSEVLPSSNDDAIESNASDCDVSDTEKQISFHNTVKKLDPEQSQSGVTVSFYFICMLHLANEKSLKLENCDDKLTDFMISNDHGFDFFNDQECKSTPTADRMKRSKTVKSYKEDEDGDSLVETDLDLD